MSNSELDILLADVQEINFAPVSLEEELIQNIKTIFSTSKYSVPLDREFGLNAKLLDMPMNVAQALLINEITEAIEKFEPRVKVTGIKFRNMEDGKLKPLLRIAVL